MTGVSVRGLTIAPAIAGAPHPVEDVSFSAPAGATTAILGAPGAGKTMLLAAMAGLVRPLRGAVFVGGQDVTRAAAGARQIGFLPPGTDLGRARSVRRALAAAAARVPAADAESLLGLFGLQGVADARLGALTHGQGYAVLAAARLLVPGQVMLLDEAGTGLDAQGRDAVMAVLAVAAEAGRAVVFATRDAGLALQADHLVLLAGGQVLQSGAPAELYAAPRDQAAARMTGPANVLSGKLRQKMAGAYVWSQAGLRFTQAADAALPPPALGGDVQFCLRPEQIVLGPGTNTLPGNVSQVFHGGAAQLARVATPLGPLMVNAPGGTRLWRGQELTLSWGPTACWPLPPV